MNTKEYLGQMKNIDRRIKDKLDEAEKWRGIAISTSVNIGEVSVQTSKKPDKMGDAVALALDYEEECRQLAICLIDIKHKITQQIDSMENVVYYNILKSHYIRGNKLEIVADEIGYSLKQTNRLYKKALMNFEEIHGHLYLSTEKDLSLNVSMCL